MILFKALKLTELKEEMVEKILKYTRFDPSTKKEVDIANQILRIHS